METATARHILYKTLQQKPQSYVQKRVVKRAGIEVAEEDAKNKKTMDSTVLNHLGGIYDKEIKEGYVATYNKTREKVGGKSRTTRRYKYRNRKTKKGRVE
jgi:hypothetical protein